MMNKRSLNCNDLDNMSLLARMQKGLKLFIEGHVTLDFEENDLIIFLVNGENDQYIVSFLDGIIRCNCLDYYNRWNRDYGSYICKHIWASIFQLIKIKFKKQFF